MTLLIPFLAFSLFEVGEPCTRRYVLLLHTYHEVSASPLSVLFNCNLVIVSLALHHALISS